MLFSKEKITSFTILTLTLSGMRGIEEYEIVCRGDESEVARYCRFYTRDEDERRLLGGGSAPTDAILQLMNDCRVLSWDGFSGPNPHGVRDGWMFRLSAEVNGRKISASGSNNYPRHYHAFFDAIRGYIKEVT